MRNVRNIRKDKQGDLSDIMVVLLITTFLAVSFIVVLYANSKVKEVIETTELNNTAAAPSILEAFDVVNSTTVQNGFGTMMGLLIIGILVSSFLVRIHPAFLFLYIIILAFTMFTAVFLGNMYDDLTDVDELATIAEDQSIINYFMEHIVIITLAVGALSMIIVFAKIFSTPGGGGGIGDI